MSFRIRGVSLALLLATAAPAAALGGEVNVSGIGGVFGVPVTSMKERRNMTVVRQQYDFSCGAAAVATLLSYHYGRPTTEEQVFRAMYAAGDKKTIQQRGFSMLEMKRYLDGLGYHSDGFRLKLERLQKIGVPVITLITTNGYTHFVVVKGMADGKILVGDPAFGVTVLDQATFETIWSGTILAIRDEPYEARKQFNKVVDWNVRPQAPVGNGVGRQGLSTFTLHLPGPRDF